MVLTQSLFYVFLMCSLLLLIYTFPSGLDAIRTPESAQSQPSSGCGASERQGGS